MQAIRGPMCINDYTDSCQNQTSADNYHMTISRAQMKDNMSLLPIQHGNETTPGRAVSQLAVV